MDDMGAPRIPGDMPITLTLTAAQWEAVMSWLAEPYRLRMQVVEEIQRQCMAAAYPPMRVAGDTQRA